MSLFGLFVAGEHISNQEEIINNQLLQMGEAEKVADKIRRDGKIACVVYGVAGILSILGGILIQPFLWFGLILGITFIILGLSVRRANGRKAEEIIEEAKQRREKAKEQRKAEIYEEEKLRVAIREEIKKQIEEEDQ